MKHLIYFFSVLKYAVFGSGPLTVLGGVEVGNNFASQSLPNMYVWKAWELERCLYPPGPSMGADQVHQQKQGLARCAARLQHATWVVLYNWLLVHCQLDCPVPLQVVYRVLHCSHMGPHLGTRVPMGTFFRFWVPIGSPFFLLGPHFLCFKLKNAWKQCSHRLMTTFHYSI